MGTASERVQNNTTEPIQVFAVNAAGNALTGLTDVQIRIRRESDGQFFDFDDLTFKAAGHTDIDEILAEVNATNAPGLYELSGGFDFSAITNKTADDVYQIVPFQSPGNNAKLPPPGTLIEGQYVENLDATISSRASTVALVAHDLAVLSAISALNNVSIADVQTALTNQGYTSGRAPNLDNLDAAITSRATAANLALLSNMTIAADLVIGVGSSATEVRTNAAQPDGFFNPINNTRQTLVVFNAAGVVARPIQAYLNTDGAFTVATLPFTPTSGDRAVVAARNSATGAAFTSDWDELLSGHTVPGSFGEYVQTQLLARIFIEAIKALEA